MPLDIKQSFLEMQFLLPFLKGVGLGASLIMVIGAQNAYVLSQGFRKRHVFATAFVCSLCDAILIIIGIAGVGTLVASSPTFTQIASWGGTIFLLGYGLKAFYSAFSNRSLEAADPENQSTRLKTTLLTVLAISLLNPHVYLDTVVLLGSIGGQLPLGERIWFGAGAVCASILWFFSLGYGAKRLAPLFKKPMAWRILDGVTGGIMWVIAGSLVWSMFPDFLH